MANVDRNELILFCEKKTTLVLSTDSRHSYECQLCSSSRRDVLLLLQIRVITKLPNSKLRTIKADFMQGALKMKLVISFNFTFCYDYFLSLNNSKFVDFVDRLYRIELEIKDTR